MISLDHGFLIVNKPKGISSRKLVDQVRRLTPHKVGHTGTLDPLASGMMVIAIGNATRFSQWIVSKDKCYDAHIQFGAQTSTDDAEGETIHTSQTIINLEQLNAALPSFTGKISQVPPQYSAIHINGKRAYKLARANQEVLMPSRDITVYKIECLSFDVKQQQTLVRIHCQSGTYIRSIARDIGLHMNSRAYLSDLKRLWVSPFEDMPLLDLDHEHLSVLDLETYFTQHSGMPIVDLNQDQALSLAHGKRITLSLTQVTAAFYQKSFIGIIEPIKEGEFKSLKLIPNVLSAIV